VAGYSAPEPASGGLRRQLYGTFAALLVAASLIALPQGTKEDLSAALRNSVLRPFIGLNQLVLTTRIRAVEADALRLVQDSLIARLMAQTTQADEIRQLRSLLGLSARAGAGWLSAEALRPYAQGSESVFILEVGVRGGVRERAPVITGEGLAGVVRELRDSEAVGMDWTHPDFAASAMSEDGLTYGLVTSERGAFREQDRLVFKDTPYNTVLDSGTVILTSGRGGTFPRGLPIGRVEGVLEAEGGWSRSYSVTPFVDPGSITTVLVGSTGGVVGDSLPDMTSVWPEGSRMRAAEREEVTVVPADSLQILQDSVNALELRIRQLQSRIGGAARIPPAGDRP